MGLTNSEQQDLNDLEEIERNLNPTDVATYFKSKWYRSGDHHDIDAWVVNQFLRLKRKEVANGNRYMATTKAI